MNYFRTKTYYMFTIRYYVLPPYRNWWKYFHTIIYYICTIIYDILIPHANLKDYTGKSKKLNLTHRNLPAIMCLWHTKLRLNMCIKLVYQLE